MRQPSGAGVVRLDRQSENYFGRIVSRDLIVFEHEIGFVGLAVRGKDQQVSLQRLRKIVGRGRRADVLPERLDVPGPGRRGGIEGGVCDVGREVENRDDQVGAVLHHAAGRLNGNARRDNNTRARAIAQTLIEEHQQDFAGRLPYERDVEPVFDLRRTQERGIVPSGRVPEGELGLHQRYDLQS